MAALIWAIKSAVVHATVSAAAACAGGTTTARSGTLSSSPTKVVPTTLCQRRERGHALRVAGSAGPQRVCSKRR